MDGPDDMGDASPAVFVGVLILLTLGGLLVKAAEWVASHVTILIH